MRLEITKEECRWLINLVEKARAEAAHYHEETRHPFFELRRDNMATLRRKLESAIERQIQRERRSIVKFNQFIAYIQPFYVSQYGIPY